jgi:hypothetical protein
VTLTAFSCGEEARTDAVDRLDRARSELGQARDRASEVAVGTPTGPAEWRLSHAENRVAAQEAWLAWVELAD